VSAELSVAREAAAAVALVLMAGSAVAAAWAVTPRWSSSDRLERCLVGAVVVLAQAVGVPLVLGLVGLLNLAAVVLVHLGVAAGAMAWRRRQPTTVAAAGAEPPGGWHPADLAGLGAAVAYVALGAALSLRRVRSFDFDTKEYHLSNLASWLQDGSIWHLPYAQPGSVTATHPGNGELLGLWLALPTHGDELVYVAPVVFGVLAIVASAFLVRELRGREAGSAGLGALAAVAVLTAPVYLATQIDSLSTDLPATAGLVAAVALLLLARRDGRAAPVALAGVALGLGLGAKYTAVAPAFLIALAGMVLLRWGRRWWLLVPGIVGFAGPWFLRNLLATGNPLFPLDLKVVDGGETPYNLLNTTMLHHLLHRNGDVVRTWVDLGADFVGPAALVVLAGVVLGILRRRANEDSTAVLVLAGLVTGATLAYLATPVTGGGPSGLSFIIASCFRYGLFGVLLGVGFGAAMLGLRAGVTILGVVLAWDAWQSPRVTAARPDLHLSGRIVAAALGLAALSVLVLALAGARRRPLPRRSPVVGAGAVAALALVGAAVVVHRDDRGAQQSVLEAVALSFGADRPAVVVGVADLRAVLGPRLERPLVGVSRGGAADEIPFTEDAQLRRRFLGDTEAPPTPPHLEVELDAAIDRTGAELLIVGSTNPVAYPDGWVPGEGWCLVGGDDQGAVFVRPGLLRAGARCEPALTP